MPTIFRLCRAAAAAAAAIIGVGALAVAAIAAQARAGLQVGATAATVRILSEDPPPATTAVEMAAARNEWRSFQVLVRSDEAVAGVAVEPGDLKGPDGAVLGAADAVLYRQHQMEITVGTYRNDKFRRGWYPDPLIPLKDPMTGKPLEGGRLKAAPFDLPARETHGFWVDVYVPADARPGEYRGTYRVTAAGAKAAEVPVALAVWDFRLPDTPALQTSFGSPADRMRSYYRDRAKAGKEKEPADWAAVEAQCARLLADHRVNATPPSDLLRPREQADKSFRIAPEKVAALRDFVDRYHVNAVEAANPTGFVKDPDGEREKLRAVLKAYDAAAAELKRPGVIFYIYLIDEPNDAKAYEFVRKWGAAIREAKSVVRVMVTEQTRTQDAAWGDLYGAVDIWCPLFSLFDPESAARRQALGETVWTYTALCQGKPTPWWHIDWPLLNYRAPAWIAWRFGQRGLLYWGSMAHWKEVDDPWTDPWTYRPGQGDRRTVYHGEGTMVYPGRAAGYDGIAPSLRLKALRDSIQDYEYLAMLERSGRAAEARKVVLPMAASWFDWETDPAAYDRARAKLAAVVLGAKRQ